MKHEMPAPSNYAHIKHNNHRSFTTYYSSSLGLFGLVLMCCGDMSRKLLLLCQTHIIWGSTPALKQRDTKSVCVLFKTTVKISHSLCVCVQYEAHQQCWRLLSLYVHVVFTCLWLTKHLGPGSKCKCLMVSDCDCVYQCVGFLCSDILGSFWQRARVGKGSIIIRGIPPQNGNWKWIQHTLLTSDLQPKQRQDREGEMGGRGWGWREKTEEGWKREGVGAQK